MRGILFGHLVKGAMIIEETGKRLGVDESLLTLLEHMLISHHGEPEYGAAVRPLFLEAEILSALDTLDADIYEIESALRDVNAGGFTNKLWALEDRKFYNHGRKPVVTDVNFDWQICDGKAAAETDAAVTAASGAAGTGGIRAAGPAAAVEAASGAAGKVSQ